MCSRYKVLAVNDAKNICECCGRQGLTRVVWIEDTTTQQLKHFGTTCAAAPEKGFGVEKEIKLAIARFTSKQKAIWQVSHSIYRQSGGTYSVSGKVANLDLMERCLTQAKADLHP